MAVNTRAHTEEADAVVAAIRAGGGSAFAVTANVTDPSAVRRMFETVADHGTAAGPGQQRLVPSPAARPDDHRRGLASGPLGHPRRRIPLHPVRAARAHPWRADRQHPRPQRTGRRPRAGAPLGGQARAARAHRWHSRRRCATTGSRSTRCRPGVDADGPELDRCRAEIASQVARLAFADAAELTGTVVRVDCDGACRQRFSGVVSASIASTSPAGLQRKGGIGKPFRPITAQHLVGEPVELVRSSSSVSLLPGVPRA